MARRRHHRRGRRGIAHVGRWVNLGFKVLGATVAAGPAISTVVGDFQSGNPGNIPQDVLYNYTGINTTTGAWNSSKLLVGVGSIAGGILIAKMGGIVARMIR